MRGIKKQKKNEHDNRNAEECRCTYNLHFRNSVASTMPMKVTPTHADISIRSHVSSNTVPKQKFIAV